MELKYSIFINKLFFLDCGKSFFLWNLYFLLWQNNITRKQYVWKSKRGVRLTPKKGSPPLPLTAAALNSCKKGASYWYIKKGLRKRWRWLLGLPKRWLCSVKRSRVEVTTCGKKIGRFSFIEIHSRMQSSQEKASSQIHRTMVKSLCTFFISFFIFAWVVVSKRWGWHISKCATASWMKNDAVSVLQNKQWWRFSLKVS